MRSAKTLARIDKQLKAHPAVDEIAATIFVTGWQSNPVEPLLLEAIANHPACKKLFFIPLDDPAGSLNHDAMQHDIKEIDAAYGARWMASYVTDQPTAAPHELLAYDITDALKREPEKRRDTAAIDAVLKNHFEKRELVPVSTSDVDIYMNGAGKSYLDAMIARRNPHAYFRNDPFFATMLDQKIVLPKFNSMAQEETGIQVAPPCQWISSLKQLDAFMREHNYSQVVLKEPSKSCGFGIFRIFRDPQTETLMGEIPSYPKDGKEAQRFSLTNDFLRPEYPMLAMKWLDNSKGDIRVVMVDGSYIGAYKREHHADTWLCNYAQGGSIYPVDLKRDLSAKDRHRLNAIGTTLKKMDIGMASIDLLADEKGDRYLSEINIGNTGDLMELSSHWDHRNAKFGRMPVADQVAGDLFVNYIARLEFEWAIAQAAQERERGTA